MKRAYDYAEKGCCVLQQPEILSSAAFGAVISPKRGNLAVGLGHKGLQFFFKQLIRCFGSGGRRRRCRTGIDRCRAVRIAEVAPGRAVLSGGLCFQPLDGEVNFAVVRIDDDNLYFLSFSQVSADIADVGVGYLRDMYTSDNGNCRRWSQKGNCAETLHSKAGQYYRPDGFLRYHPD